MTPITDDTFQTRFIELSGELSAMCSFNRSIGQIYGLLYITPEPLSLEDIAKACRMSKGNASIHLRTLETWGAVHQSSRAGSRKDYYSANTDLRSLAIRRLQEGVARRLDHASHRIQEIKEDPTFAGHIKKAEGAHWQARLTEIESLIQQVNSGFTLMPKLFELKKLLPL